MSSKIPKEKILSTYQQEVESLRKLGREWDLSDEVIDSLIEDSFKHFSSSQCQKKSSTIVQKKPKKKKINVCLLIVGGFCVFLCVIFIASVLLTFHKPSYNFVVRNVQELIYPAMKLIRWVALPIVRTFPSITVWYDELCLLENPYFRPVDISCWPCEEVRSILDLTDTENPQDYQPHSAFPYLVKGASAEVTYAQLRKMYFEHQAMLDRDATYVQSSEPKWKSVTDIFSHNLDQNPTPKQDSHVLWRLNRMEPVRAIRKLFPRPKFMSGIINVERFLIIDEPHAPQYMLPFPEGYKVFMMQGSGERLIVLEPVQACASNCTRVSVLLKPSHFLFYNSWYYRPWSSPAANSTTIAVTYIGSH